MYYEQTSHFLQAFYKLFSHLHRAFQLYQLPWTHSEVNTPAIHWEYRILVFPCNLSVFTAGGESVKPSLLSLSIVDSIRAASSKLLRSESSKAPPTLNSRAQTQSILFLAKSMLLLYSALSNLFITSLNTALMFTLTSWKGDWCWPSIFWW